MLAYDTLSPPQLQAFVALHPPSSHFFHSTFVIPFRTKLAPHNHHVLFHTRGSPLVPSTVSAQQHRPPPRTGRQQPPSSSSGGRSGRPSYSSSNSSNSRYGNPMGRGGPGGGMGQRGLGAGGAATTGGKSRPFSSSSSTGPRSQRSASSTIQSTSKLRKQFESTAALPTPHDSKAYLAARTDTILRLASENKLKDALQVFDRTSRPDVALFNTVIHLCAKNNLTVKALEYLNKLKFSSYLQPDMVSYTYAINACTKSRKWEKGLELFHEMLDKNIQPNLMTYNLLLSALEKEQKVQNVIQLFNHLKSNQNVQPDSFSYNTVVSAFDRVGDWEKALFYFEESKEKGSTMDILSYHTVINACIKANQWEKVDALQRDMIASGLKPTILTYTSAIDACAITKNCEKASHLLNHATQNDVHPNIMAYNKVLYVYEIAGQADAFPQLIQDMAKFGLKPDQTSYTHYINALVNANRPDQAIDLFHNEIQKQNRLGRNSANAILRAYNVIADHRGAYTVYQDMKAKNISPNLETFTSLIESAYSQGLHHRVLDFYNELRSNGVQPDRSLYHVLIASASHLDDCSDQMLLYYREARNISLDKQAWLSILRSCAGDTKRTDKSVAMYSVIKDMIANHVQPSENMYLECLPAFKQEGNWKFILDFIHQLQEGAWLQERQDDHSQYLPSPWQDFFAVLDKGDSHHTFNSLDHDQDRDLDDDDTSLDLDSHHVDDQIPMSSSDAESPTPTTPPLNQPDPLWLQVLIYIKSKTIKLYPSTVRAFEQRANASDNPNLFLALLHKSATQALPPYPSEIEDLPDLQLDIPDNNDNPIQVQA